MTAQVLTVLKARSVRNKVQELKGMLVPKACLKRARRIRHQGMQWLGLNCRLRYVLLPLLRAEQVAAAGVSVADMKLKAAILPVAAVALLQSLRAHP